MIEENSTFVMCDQKYQRDISYTVITESRETSRKLMLGRLLHTSGKEIFIISTFKLIWIALLFKHPIGKERLQFF